MTNKSCDPLCFNSHALIASATRRALLVGWRNSVQSTDVSVFIPMEPGASSKPGWPSGSRQSAQLSAAEIPLTPGKTLSPYACATAGNTWDKCDKGLLNTGMLLFQRVKILLPKWKIILFLWLDQLNNIFRDIIGNKLYAPYCKKKNLKTAEVNSVGKVHEKWNKFTKNWWTWKIIFFP